jgi:glycerophosphoryl diester phosphodiesterase
MAYASDTRRAEIIGHRGSPRDFRENTLPSFARAFDVGSDAVELDVHTTSDGVVVVHHDAVTNSRTGETGPRLTIAESTLASLRAAPIAGGPIPTLESVLSAVPDTSTVYVEVKAPHVEHAVISVIRSSNRRCAVHSFDHRIVRRVHELAPEIPVGVLQTSYPIDPLRPMHDAGARDLWQHWELIDPALIDSVHADAGRVIAWTVNDTAVARRLLDWGIDGLCSDIPETMRAVADSR